MSRAVYIGGFGNGEGSAERVSEALTASYYDDVHPLTFSRAMEDQDEVHRAVEGVDVITHSAGLLAVVGANPRRIEAFGAPLPSSKIALVGKTIVKTVRMHTPGVGIRSVGDLSAVSAYDLSATEELFTHLRGNLGRLGQISRFNAVYTAREALRVGIASSLIYTNGDEYFSLSHQDEATAAAEGVNIVRIPGIVDELVIRPEATLQRAGVEHRL
jgi:hypothetical protein